MQMEMDLLNLQALQSSVNAEKIIELSKRVKRAHTILIVEIDLAAVLSWHLGYGLMTLGFNAEAPVGSTGNVQRRVRSLVGRTAYCAQLWAMPARYGGGRSSRQSLADLRNHRQRNIARRTHLRRQLYCVRCQPLLWRTVRRSDELDWDDFDCLRAYADSALFGIASPK